MLTYLFGVILSGIIWYIIVRKLPDSGEFSDLVIWFILTAISWIGVTFAVVSLLIKGIENLLKKLPADFWNSLARRFFALGQKKG